MNIKIEPHFMRRYPGYHKKGGCQFKISHLRKLNQRRKRAMYILLNINRCNELPLENSFLKPLNFFLQNIQIMVFYTSIQSFSHASPGSQGNKIIHNNNIFHQ